MWLLLLLILAVLVLGVWGAVKVAFWVLLIALAVAVVAGFLGRARTAIESLERLVVARLEEIHDGLPARREADGAVEV